jgi:hypothetical protein
MDPQRVEPLSLGMLKEWWGKQINKFPKPIRFIWKVTFWLRTVLFIYVYLKMAYYFTNDWGYVTPEMKAEIPDVLLGFLFTILALVVLVCIMCICGVLFGAMLSLWDYIKKVWREA